MSYTYSKCLTKADYETFSEHALVVPFQKKVHPYYRFEHDHRKWEYGLLLKFLLEIKAESVLEVGGGGSIVAPLLSHQGMEVTVIDPMLETKVTIEKQNEILGTDVKFVNKDFLEYRGRKHFNAVVCISTLEHIPTPEGERRFYKKLLKYGDALFLTTDFSPSAKQYSQAHYRTYNKISMNKLVNMAKNSGFKPYGEVDYTFGGEMVYGYTFASLALVKGG